MILEASNVVKNFGGLTAVNRVSLQVDEGEIIGLIGPNGAGKTTFLNCLAGTFRPSCRHGALPGGEHNWSFGRRHVPPGYVAYFPDSASLS